MTYAEQPHDSELSADRPDLYAPDTVNPNYESDTAEGDVAAAMATAAVTVEQTYETAMYHNNPLEPHATTALWEPDADVPLTLWDSTQGVHPDRSAVSTVFGMATGCLSTRIISTMVRSLPRIVADALQGFAQDCSLDFQLMLVAGVLVMAAAAPPEVGTGGRDAQGGRRQHRLECGAAETGLGAGQRGFYPLALEHKGNENRLLAAGVGAVNSRQAVAAVHEFFDGEFHLGYM